MVRVVLSSVPVWAVPSELTSYTPTQLKLLAEPSQQRRGGRAATTELASWVWFASWLAQTWPALIY